MKGVHTVGGQMEVLEEVVGQSLRDVCAIKFQRHEHDARKDHDPRIDLSNQSVFFAPVPSSRRVEAVQVFP